MLRITLSLAFVALGVAFSTNPNTPHTGCNDAAPEVVQALTVEQGYARHQFKSCEDIAAAGGCSTLEKSAYSEICCASCARMRQWLASGEEIRSSRKDNMERR